MPQLFIVLFALFTSQLVHAVTEFTLDNGLKILIKEDHRAPVATVMMWYKVGAGDDPAGETGLSHVLEHLMFKGTKRFPKGVFSSTIAEHGGQENALTSQDFTAFFEKIAVSQLPLILDLEADRMQHLLLDKIEFNKEMQVIKAERRLRTEDNPQGLTFERFLATAHLDAAYQHPVIGWMNDLEQLSLDNVRHWYQTHYTPNQVVLVVVGDVEPNNVYQFAKSAFRRLKPITLPPVKHHQEPPFLGKKSVEVHLKAQIPFLLQGYTVPSVSQNPNDAYTLEVIAGILSAGDSARLTHQLVHTLELASSLSVNYNLYTRFETQFIVYATPTSGHTLHELGKAIQHELHILQTQPVSEAELTRVKTQLIAQKTFEQDSLFGQAMELGLLESIGLGYKTADKYTSAIQGITPEMIQTVANTYFQPLRQTDAYLIPEQEKPHAQ